MGGWRSFSFDTHPHTLNNMFRYICPTVCFHFLIIHSPTQCLTTCAEHHPDLISSLCCLSVCLPLVLSSQCTHPSDNLSICLSLDGAQHWKPVRSATLSYQSINQSLQFIGIAYYYYISGGVSPSTDLLHVYAYVCIQY